MEDKDLLQKYIDIAGVILVAIDADHKVSFINRRGIDILKYSKEEIIGKNWFDNFLPQWDRDKIEAVYEKLMAGDESLEYFENPVLTKNGEERIISWHNAALKDDEGNIIGTLSSGEDITERRKVEGALTLSEKLYRSVVNDQTELICRWRSDSTLTFVNDAYCRYFGKNHKELIGSKFIPLIPDEDHEKVKRHFASINKNNPVATHEHRVYASGGEIRWQQWTNRAICDESGRIIEYQSVGQDITERKKVEEELKKHREHLEVLVEERTLELNRLYAGLAESETRFKDISEQTQSWIWEVDASGKYTYSGPVVEKIFGYRPEEVIGKYFYDFFDPENKEETKKVAFDYFSEKKPFSEFINRNVNKKGRTVWLSTSGIPLIDKDGNLTGYRGADIDITERKRVEEDLHRQQQFTQQIIDTSPNIIYILDLKERKTIFINHASLNVMGYSPEELREMGSDLIFLLIHPDDATGLKSHMKECEQAGDNYIMEHEYRLRHRNGEWLWFHSRHAPFKRASDGTVRHIIGVARDITEKKKNESELMWKNRLLQILHNVQFNFIADEDPSVIFDTLLNGFLEITGSEYGFIGELFAGPGGKPFLKTHAITNISWNDESRKLYEEMKQTGMEFRNLDTLYGSVITSGRHVVSNDPAADPRSKGVPEGHPPLNSFLGLPFYRGDKMIGMVGLANRENGYVEELVSSLQPLLVSYSNIIEAYRVEQQKKKSEQKLLDSEEKYRLIIENICEIIYKVKGDPRKGTVEFVGPQVEKILGYKPADFIKNPELWFTLLHPDDVSQVMEKTQNITTVKEPLVRTYRLRRKDSDTYIWVEDRVMPILNEKGEITGIQGLARDITDRMINEDKIRLAEERYRALFEQSPDGIMLEDPDTMRPLEFNRSICDLLGYSAEEFSQLRISDFEAQESPEEIRRHIEKIIREGQDTFETKLRTKNGEIRHVIVAVQVIELLDRRYLHSIIHDITARKMIEEEKERLIRDIQSTVRQLSASQKEWHDTFDAIQDIIYITDKEYTLLKVNKAFARYFGKTPQEVINRKCYTFFHHQECPVSNCPHEVTLMSNKLETSEIVEPLKNRLFKITSFPYSSHAGDLVGSICIARDITEEREKEMKNILNDRLASLGQMSAAIAHEINNPLASITACAEGLLKRLKIGKIDPELFDSYLNIIEEESFRCKKITENMLSFVRVEKRGKEKIDIHAMLDKSLELVGLQNRLANVDVTKDYAENLPAIKGNELEFSQVFASIITNALDAMNDEGSITLATQIEESFLTVLISDTGPGIPKDHANKIFEPFFTTKARSGGTGLGLSIANQIIRSHGGEIEVLSGKDKGAVIKISLPIEPAH